MSIFFQIYFGHYCMDIIFNKYRCYLLLLAFNIFLLNIAFGQTTLKVIPLLGEQEDTVGFVKLSKTLSSNSSSSSIWIEFNNGKSIIVDNRLGEIKNGDINIINDLHFARFNEDFVTLIWELGKYRYPVANLFKLVDFTNNTIHHICGQYLGFPNKGVQFKFEFMDSNTIYVKETRTTSSCDNIYRLLQNGTVEKLIQYNDYKSCLEFLPTNLDTTKYIFSLKEDTLQQFYKLSSQTSKYRIIKEGKRIN